MLCIVSFVYITLKHETIYVSTGLHNTVTASAKARPGNAKKAAPMFRVIGDLERAVRASSQFLALCVPDNLRLVFGCLL